MSHQTVKIHNTRDFEQITKGIKVAQCMQVKSCNIDAEKLLNNLEDLCVSKSLSCSFCNTVFRDKTDQRLHYKLDWHRFNLKRSLNGLKPVSVESFDLLTHKTNTSSLSESENDSQDEVDHDSLNNSIQKSSDAENVDGKTDVSRHSKVFFENDEGYIFGLYRCLLYRKKEVFEVNDEMIAQALKCGKEPLWTVIMIGGGHFAAAVFKNGEPVVHKTFHCYTVRAKQGSSQNSRDNRNASSSFKSGGANLRRHNENNLVQNVQEILESWSSHVTNSSLILYRAVGRFNRSILFGGKNAPLDKEDARLRQLPFPTKRPTFNEVKRVYDMLSDIEVYGLASDFTDNFPTSPRNRTRRKPANKLQDQSLIENENKVDDTISPSSNKSIPRNSETPNKNNRTPIDRAKPRKSPHRPLPDIVAALAHSSSESEFDSQSLDDINVHFMELNSEINLVDRLQECDTPLKYQKKNNRRSKTKNKFQRGDSIDKQEADDDMRCKTDDFE